MDGFVTRRESTNLRMSQKLSDEHKDERDSARTERDSARVERDQARTERDGFKDQADDQVQSSRAQEQFVATLSHDLRSPIGAIKMAIEIMRDGAEEKQPIELIDLIDRNADQAAELISQLLDAHLIKSGARLPLEIEKCDLLDVLKKCHNSMAPQNKRKIILDCSSEKIAGFWDAGALERAIKNLISNAVKFSDQDKEIYIHLWQGPDITSLSIQNFGEIISLEDQLRIFENHYRAQQRGFENKIGWGLGLTLVKGIALAHNGKVDVTSSKLEGTVFTLRLPNDARGGEERY